MNSFSQQVWHILAHPSEVSKILCESVGCFRCFDVAHGSLLEIPSLSMESSTWLARFAAELEGDDEKGPIQVLQGEKDGKFGFSMFLMSWNWGNFETVAVKKKTKEMLDFSSINCQYCSLSPCQITWSDPEVLCFPCLLSGVGKCPGLGIIVTSFTRPYLLEI